MKDNLTKVAVNDEMTRKKKKIHQETKFLKDVDESFATRSQLADNWTLDIKHTMQWHSNTTDSAYNWKLECKNIELDRETARNNKRKQTTQLGPTDSPESTKGGKGKDQ